MGKGAKKPIGSVIHWYDKISVAVVKLSSGLKVGDAVKVVRGDTEFEEKIASMQLDHSAITSGKKGQEVAIKFKEQAKEGAQIFKV